MENNNEKEKLDRLAAAGYLTAGTSSVVGGLGLLSKALEKAVEKKGLKDVGRKLDPSSLKIAKRTALVGIPLGAGMVGYSKYRHYKQKREDDNSKK